MNTQFRKDLKFALKAVVICFMIAVAVRSYSKLKETYCTTYVQQIEKTK